MKANYEDKIPKKTSEVSLGNLYDMNKQLMTNETGISAEVKEAKYKQLIDWIKYNYQSYYFMMLCHERRDYTVFHFKDTVPSIGDVQSMAADVFECMNNRGTLLALDLQDAGGWELWLRADDGEISAYYLFPYGEAVLEY
jgi:hypothetical protein